MHFLNSPLLWGGLGLLGVSVPIIIHLLNRYRHKQVDWAAMELLKRAMTIRSRQIRIEDILLMILRCLAMLLIALALMRPTITSSGAHWMGQQQVGAVIAIDASYSMSHREATTRFDRAKSRVQEVLDLLHPGDPITLVLMGNRNRVLLRNVGYDKDRFAKAIAEAQMLPEPLNVLRCLSDTDPSSPGLNQLRDELKAPERECYIITDAGASKWKNLSDAAPLASLGEKGSVLFLPIPEESIENLAVTRFDFAAGSLRHGNTARFTAEVRNFGRVAAPGNTTISLLANDQPVDQRVITVEPGESQVIPFFYHCDAPGDIKLTARLSQDAMTIDNERHVVAHVRDRLRILCVDGDIAQGTLRYINNALAPKATPIYKSMMLENVSSLDLPQRPLTDFDLLILANVGNLEPEQTKKIAAFVQQGGGLIIFPGDHIDPVTFNAQMRVGDVSLLPGELGELTKAPAKFEGWSVEAGATSHRLAGALQHLPRDITQQPTILQFLNIKLSKGSAEVLRIAGVNTPLLAEKQFGQGRVLLWATTADNKWGTFVINPLFPAVMNDAVTLLSQRPNERPLFVGAPILLPLAPERAQDNIVVKNPAGVETPTKSLTTDNHSIIDYRTTDQPGFYEVKVGDTTTIAAVNLDPSASDVAFLDRGGLVTAFRNLPVKTVYPGKDDLPTVVRQSRNGTELWQKLLGAGLFLLLLESFLARRFSRRMASGKGVTGVSRRDEVLGQKPAAAAA